MSQVVYRITITTGRFSEDIPSPSSIQELIDDEICDDAVTVQVDDITPDSGTPPRRSPELNAQIRAAIEAEDPDEVERLLGI